LLQGSESVTKRHCESLGYCRAERKNATAVEQPSVTDGSIDPDAVVTKLAGDMNFIGVLTIIGGAFYCLTIIGAIVGIPMIIAGIRLNESCREFREYRNTKRAANLFRALEREGRFFFILKVLTIAYLCLMVIYLAVLLIGLITSL
jgi:hypothetical protein